MMQSFHVGLPCLKLSLSPSTQKHHGKAAKTCSVGDAWKEMNDEREGRDKTIDHELTKDNVWLCGNTDMDLEQVVQSEIDMINSERAEFGKRKMRVDAISAIELIQKPPMEVRTAMKWSNLFYTTGLPSGEHSLQSSIMMSSEADPVILIRSSCP